MPRALPGRGVLPAIAPRPSIAARDTAGSASAAPAHSSDCTASLRPFTTRALTAATGAGRRVGAHGLLKRVQPVRIVDRTERSREPPPRSRDGRR